MRDPGETLYPPCCPICDNGIEEHDGSVTIARYEGSLILVHWDCYDHYFIGPEDEGEEDDCEA